MGNAKWGRGLLWGFLWTLSSACTALLDRDLLRLLGDAVGPTESPSSLEDDSLLPGTTASAVAATGRVKRVESQADLFQELVGELKSDLGFNGQILVMEQTGDFSLALGGQFTSVLSTPAGALARFSDQGKRVPGPLAFDGAVTVIRRARDGNFWVGGSFTTYGGQSVVRNLVKVDANGQLIPEWKLSGSAKLGFDGPVRALLETELGLWVGGSFSEFIGQKPAPASPGLVLLEARSPQVLEAFVADGLKNLDGEVWDLAPDLQSAGSIYVAGDFTSADQAPSLGHLMRLGPRGQLDSQFVLKDGAFNSTVTQVLPLKDGSILGGGLFTAQARRPRLGRIVRLNRDGSAHSDFQRSDTMLSGFNSDVLALEADGEGGAFVGGLFTLYNGKAVPRLARLRADGRLDSRFFVGSTGFNGAVHDLKLDLDQQSLWVGGAFSSFEELDDVFGLVKLRLDGNVEPRFLTQSGFSESLGTPQVSTIEVGVQGQAWVGGRFKRVGGLPSIGRFTEIDLATLRFKEPFPFGPLKAGFDSTVLAMAVGPDGQVAVGGSFSSVSGLRREALALWDLKSRQIDPNFAPRVKGAVHGLFWDRDKRLLLVGTFPEVDGQARSRVARVLPEGQVDPSFDPKGGPRGTPWSVAEWQGSIFVAGAFSAWNGQTKVQNLARLNNDGGLNPQWQFQSDGEIRTLVPTPSGLYVAGRFRKLQQTSFQGLARLQSTGSLDFGFRPALSLKPGEFIRSLSFSDKEIFVLLSTNQIRRLDLSGRLQPFQPLVSDGDILSMKYSPLKQQLLIAGSFSQIQTQDRASFAALNAKTGELLSSLEAPSFETKSSQ